MDLECQDIAEGLLERGIKTGITTIAQNSLDVINEFYASGRNITDQQKYLNQYKFKASGIIIVNYEIIT